jgi:hypothetical protein
MLRKLYEVSSDAHEYGDKLRDILEGEPEFVEDARMYYQMVPKNYEVDHISKRIDLDMVLWGGGMTNMHVSSFYIYQTNVQEIVYGPKKKSGKDGD